MRPRLEVPGVWRLGNGFVNAFLVESDKGLTLIDTGVGRSAKGILAAVHELGRQPGDVSDIVITHLHGDHTGGLAEVKRACGAEVWMHPADAALVREGITGRPVQPGRGLLRQLAARTLSPGRPAPKGAPVAVEHEVLDGETLPCAGLLAIHTPGHTQGHLALLLPRSGGVLFVADAATNYLRLRPSPVYENWAEGRRSFEKLAALEFEVACFSHGRTIKAHAAERLRALLAGRP